jgi:hypothetical protein
VTNNDHVSHKLTGDSRLAGSSDSSDSGQREHTHKLLKSNGTPNFGSARHKSYQAASANAVKYKLLQHNMQPHRSLQRSVSKRLAHAIHQKQVDTPAVVEDAEFNAWKAHASKAHASHQKQLDTPAVGEDAEFNAWKKRELKRQKKIVKHLDLLSLAPAPDTAVDT